MHAEFVLTPGQLLFDRLPALFGARDLAAVTASPVLQHLTDKANPRYWAAEDRPGYRLSAWWATTGTMRLIVEPTGAVDLRATCQELWDEVRVSAPDLGPAVVSLALQHDGLTQPLAEAQIGRFASAKRTEMVWTFSAALASLLWLLVATAIFGWSEDLMLGAIPAIVIGLAAGVQPVRDSRSTALYWG
jgi:hypothetical protein